MVVQTRLLFRAKDDTHFIITHRVKGRVNLRYIQKQDIHYNLRQRSYSLTLPSEDNNLIRKNFLHMMLF